MADIIVKHKTFGEGKYVSIYGHYIEIQFSNGLKKFMFPNAFDNNMLETDDPWLINKIRQALNAVGKQYLSVVDQIVEMLSEKYKRLVLALSEIVLDSSTLTLTMSYLRSLVILPNQDDLLGFGLKSLTIIEKQTLNVCFQDSHICLLR